jgi:hypothetical protein
MIASLDMLVSGENETRTVAFQLCKIDDADRSRNARALCAVHDPDLSVTMRET